MFYFIDVFHILCQWCFFGLMKCNWIIIIIISSSSSISISIRIIRDSWECVVKVTSLAE
jgi:hypothetical protein